MEAAFLSYLKLDHGITYIIQLMTEANTHEKKYRKTDGQAK